jgi:tetratricopeptide (TPR) repeat protein
MVKGELHRPLKSVQYSTLKSRFTHTLYLDDGKSWAQYQIPMKRRTRALASEHNQLGVTFYQNGAIDLALDQLKRATKRAPWVASYWLNLGVTLLDKDALEDAESALKRAIELYPQGQSAHFHLAQLHVKRCDNATALEYYQRTVELGPDTYLAQRARERLEGWQPRIRVKSGGPA